MREALPNVAIQMLLRGRNTVGYTPYPTAVTDAFVRRGRVHRRRHLPHLRRAQRRRPAEARGRRGARDRHRRRRGRALLHRQPARPGRGPLHARLLPASRGRHRRGRRAHPGDQGHGGAAARRCRRDAGRPRSASASTCRCTCTPTTPRAVSSPLCSPRAAPVPTPSTPPAPRWPARRASRQPVGARRRHGHTERDTGLGLQAVSDLEPYWEAVRKRVPAVRVGPSRDPPAGCTGTRSRAVSCPTCASRPSRSDSATGSRSSRICTRRPATSWAGRRR